MELKLEIEPRKVVRELNWHGETIADEQELIRIEEVGEIADEALRQLENIIRQTDSHRGNLSAEELREKVIQIASGLKLYFDEEESSLGAAISSKD